MTGGKRPQNFRPYIDLTYRSILFMAFDFVDLFLETWFIVGRLHMVALPGLKSASKGFKDLF